MASRQFTVDSVKKQEFISIFLLMPETSVSHAMRKAEFPEEDITDLLLRRFLQGALPGGSIKGLKAYIARQRKPPPHLPVDPAAAHPRSPMTQQYLAVSTKTATAAAATVPPAAVATVPPEVVIIHAGATTVLLSLLPGTATKCKKDRKRWNCTSYQRKKNKMRGLFLTTTTTTTMMTTQTLTLTMTMTMTQTTTTTTLCLDDHWVLNANGTMRTPLAQRVTKHRQVKPAVDGILSAGNTVQQGALLWGVLDHPSMFSAQKMAAIDSSKESAAAKYVVGQSARMMERNRNTSKLHGNSTTEKHHAVEVILAFSSPSP